MSLSPFAADQRDHSGQPEAKPGGLLIAAGASLLLWYGIVNATLLAL